MNLGNRYYQVIYPIQMGRRELDTRDRRNQGYGKVDLISLNSYNIAKLLINVCNFNEK